MRIDADAVADAVLDIIEEPIAALSGRIEGLEKRAPEPGARGEPGPPGKDAPAVTREQVIDAILSMPDVIGEAVEKYLAANPPAAGVNGTDGRDGVDGVDGKDGRDGADGQNGKDGTAGIEGKSGLPGENGVDGRDGVGLAGAVIDRSGDLVVTMTNGEHKNLGPVLGRDGADGRDGVDGLAGVPGQAGVDGLGFDDFDLVEGERGLVLRFSRGTIVKEFSLPVVVDRGVWREQAYVKGNGVTWAGSFWIAQRDTSDKPETSDAWRLAVKRGRDGKDGKAA